MFRFIHAADIHLDSPLVGLEKYEGAPTGPMRGATRQALENLVKLAIAEKVAFLLIAGDLYDGDWKDYNTGLFLVKEMAKLRDARIQVFMVAGNHDAASVLTKNLTNLPDNVTRFSSKTPETHRLEETGVAIHGQSFSKRAVTDDLSAGFPVAEEGLLNIGLLHTCATGREGHEAYAPCTLDGLLAKGYQYWALGHVHKREILHEKPYILFPGNTQGRQIREAGPKGCTLVTVEDQGVIALEHRNLDVLRWAMIECDASGSQDGDAILERARLAIKKEMENSEGCFLAARLVVSGACKAHNELSVNPEKWINEIRGVAVDEGSGAVWLEKVVLRTSMQLDVHEIMKRPGSLGDLLRMIRELDSEEGIAWMANELEPIMQKLRAETRQGVGALDLDKPEKLREILEDVQQMLIPMLLEK